MQAALNKRNSYQDFLHGFGNFTDAVTILLKNRHPEHHIWWRDDMAEPTAKWFLDRLNKKIYGRKYSGGHRCLGVAISYERGTLTERPHFHFAIERPTHLTRHKFHQLIHEVFIKMDWRAGTIHISPYLNAPFLRYICKGNFESFLLGVCSRA